MALNKQAIPINFSQGIDTKADPKQVQMGKFLALQNSVFTKTGALTKRNGFGEITQLPNDIQTTLTTLSGNLLATGSNLYAFSQETDQWLNQGSVQPVSLNVQSILRNSASQSCDDIAVAPSGLACTVYIENSIAYYIVVDTSTGQQIVPRTAIENTATTPRVFALGAYFIVTFLSVVSGSPHLRFIAIPTVAPQSPKAAADISTDVSGTDAGYDAIVANNVLYAAWAGSANNMHLNSLSPTTLLTSATKTITGHTASLVSVTADISGSTAVVWLSFWDGTPGTGSGTAYVAGYDHNLTPLPDVPVTNIQTSILLNTMTSVAASGVLTVILDLQNTYDFAPHARTDYIATIQVTQTGTVGSIDVFLRSVGLASKPIIDNGIVYVLVAYGETNQPTYFLVDISGTVYLRLAYANGGGYETTQVLPSISLVGQTYYVSYLFKDFLTTINKGTNLASGSQSNAIYTQTGINLAKFELNTSGQYSSEIADTLHLTGGKLWMYDGVKPVEHGFNVWPENMAATSAASGGGLAPQQYYYQFTYEWTDNQGNLHRSAPSIPLLVDNTKLTTVETTATFTAGATTIIVASATGLAVGQVLSDITTPGNFANNTVITAISGTTVTINNATVGASGAGVGDTIQSEQVLSFTAAFTAGSSTMTVSSATGLQVGQTLTDVTSANSLQANTYIAAISGTTITLSLPAVSTATADTVVTPDITSNTINIPTLRLTDKQPGPVGLAAGEQITNPVRIVGYRWSVAQQVYYQFTSVTSPLLNTTTADYVTIVDDLSDAAILGNAIIYTTGGVVEDIAAPASTVSCLYKSRLILVDAEDQNLLWYSKQVIESTPVEMSDLLTIYVAPTSGAQGSTGAITALSAMDDKLIVFKKDAIYYITGNGPDNTGANNDFSDPIFITASVGCTNPNSIVLSPAGIMFQSDKGIWLLGRDLSTTYIGAPVEGFNSQMIESAQVIPGTNQVRFLLADSSITLMYDYYFQQWGTFTNLSAISSTLYNGAHTYLNDKGVVYQEQANTYIDGSAPVLMSFTSSWMSLAGLQGFERFYFLYLLGTYHTPFKLSVQLAYDYNTSASQFVTVSPNNYSAPWGGDPLWGAGALWGGASNVFETRIFPATQKCETFQLTITEVYDSSLGVPAGQGLSLSGMNIVIGAKKGYRTQTAGQSFG